MEWVNISEVFKMANAANPGNNPGGKVPTPGQGGKTVGPPTSTSKTGATSASGSVPSGQGPNQGKVSNQPVTSDEPQSQLNLDAVDETDEGRTTINPATLPKFPDNLMVNQGQAEDASESMGDEFDGGHTEPGLIKDFDPKHPAKLKGETEETRKVTKKGEQEVVPKQVDGPPTPPYAPSQNYDGQLPPPSNEAVTNERREGSVEEGMPGLIQTAEVRGTTYVDSAITAKQMQHGMKTSTPVKRDRRTKLGRFLVQHPDNPALYFAAVDRLQAIQLYRQHCGIIASDKETSVTEVN